MGSSEKDSLGKMPHLGRPQEGLFRPRGCFWGVVGGDRIGGGGGGGEGTLLNGGELQ